MIFFVENSTSQTNTLAGFSQRGSYFQIELEVIVTVLRNIEYDIKFN